MRNGRNLLSFVTNLNKLVDITSNICYTISIKQRYKNERGTDMETLYKGNYGGEFRLDSRYINKITFYDDNGIVCVCNKDIYKEDNKEEVEQLNILQVLKTDKSFRKQETEQEFINKQMKKKINFSYVGKEKKWYDNENKLELFIYVDNEFVKLISKKQRVEVCLHEYDFTKGYTYFTDVLLEVDGQIIKNTSYDKHEVVDQTELQEQAKALFDEVVRVSYIQESEFNRIFNQYKLVKRDTPLLTE